MSASVNIKRGDLHLTVSEAFNRGRYVLMTGGGDGRPIEITIDLRERPDDLFEREAPSGDEVEATDLSGLRIGFPPRREDIGKWKPFSTDDHGASVPAQGDLTRSAEVVGEENGWAVREPGPRVYEFALQDVERPKNDKARWIISLDSVSIRDAPDEEAAEAADWVHVYDRVTRERRTLKRPAADAVLTGLRDVAADLRKRGDPVEPPFGCAPIPQVGPLTSTEGLKAGDVLRVIDAATDCVGFNASTGDVVRFSGQQWGEVQFNGGEYSYIPSRFAFVGRPDADGWVPWSGGENPVPGARVDYRTKRAGMHRFASDVLRWEHIGEPDDIVAFRIVDADPKP